MNGQFNNFILQVTGASKFAFEEEIQKLWSGYGSICRYSLQDSKYTSVVIKQIDFGKDIGNSRGWTGSVSHNRKVRSYQIEKNWYENFNDSTNENCRTPKCLGVLSIENEVLIVLEDLNSVGFELRRNSVNKNELKVAIKWLANFHALNMGREGEGLWEIGSYWHLETRPDELEALKDLELKNAANEIDSALNNCTYKTIIHGDAKLANFCFSSESNSIAGVDFQYVGLGCGMKDLAYFVGSCLTEEECEEKEQDILSEYFSELKEALGSNFKSRFSEIEKEWRSLYKYAWADFHRFLKGWSPGHWKINSYSESICRAVIKEIKINSELEHLAEKAVEAAVGAGAFVLKSLKKEGIQIAKKSTGTSLASKVVTEVDKGSEKIILESISESIKTLDLGLLTEESVDDGSRFEKSHFWCVDPLDGTLPFTEGKEGFSIAISFISKEGESLIGVVYDPSNKIAYKSIKGKGLYVNGEIWKGSKESSDKLIFNTDRSLLKAKSFIEINNLLIDKASQLERTLVVKSGPGAVLNALNSLLIKPSVYLKPAKSTEGGGCIWDFAASTRIFQEAGLKPTDFKGNELNFNRRESVFFNDIGVRFENF